MSIPKNIFRMLTPILILILIFTFFATPAYAEEYTWSIEDGFFDNGTEIMFPNVTIDLYINGEKKKTVGLIRNENDVINLDEARKLVTDTLPEEAQYENGKNVPLTVNKDDRLNVIELYYSVIEKQYTIDKAKFQNLAQAKAGTITFSTTPLTDDIVGTDLSAAGDGSIIGVEDGENVTIYSKNGKTYAPEDSSNMFEAFQSSSINCLGLNTSNTINMNHMFYDCQRLRSIDISSFNTSNVTDMSGMFEIKDYKQNYLTTLDVSSFDTSNVTDMSYMFKRCSNLTNLDLSNFNTSKVTNMKGMFYVCGSLTSLNVSNFNTSSVTNMAGMFSSCYELTDLDLNNFNTSNVTTMQGMFAGCHKLTTLNVGSFDTSNVIDMGQMFSSCKNLTTIDLNNFNTSKVTDMQNMFNFCSKLTTLNISSFNTSKVNRMNGMFQSCSSLTSLNLSNFDTSNVTSMSWMFKDCSNLKTLDISSFDIPYNKYQNYTEWMFQSCSNLTIIAKTEADKTKIENSTDFPSTCTVIVKQ